MIGIKQFIKAPAIRVLDRLGYVALQASRLDTLPIAKHLAKLFSSRKIDCVFDVGANLGQYAGFLRNDVGYTGRIVSIEPVTHQFDILREASKADPGWTVLQAALGARTGRQSINITRSSDFSSFLTPDNSQTRQYESSNEIVAREEVPLLTLEEVFLSDPAYRTATIYLKMDTQGYDLQVLKGGGEALSRVVALQSEMSVKPLYASMPDYTEASAAIRALGFVPSGMFPISVDANMALIEFEGIFVRPTLESA